MKKTIYAILPFLLIAGVFLAGSWYGQQGAVKAVTAATPSARQILYYVDPMHPTYKSDKPGIAPDCGMELVPVYSDGTMGGEESTPAEPPGAVIISPERQQLIGVQVRPVAKAAVTQSLRLLGRVAPDEARVYRVNAGIEGFIREVAPVTTGDHVTKDQLLATFSAPNAYNVIQLYILNLGAVDRIVQSAAAGSVDAQAAPAGAANLQLRVDQMEQLGVSPRQMEEIRRARQIPQSIQILSPADGIVLTRNVSPGVKFDKGAEWYRIADLRRVWILVDVFENEAQYLQPGKIVKVSLPQQNKTFQARVSPVRPQFDPATRTLKVRLEADNPGDILRPDMFVDVELPVSTTPMIAVPVDAVVDSGLTQTVFVDRGEGRFEPRRVETGAHFGDRVEITKGLMEGERIVVSGTFLLDSESRMKLTAQGATGPTHLRHTHSVEGQIAAASTAGSSAHMHTGQMAPSALAAARDAILVPTGPDHMGHQP